ncbi:MAG: 50S ribosomal protein L20 [Chloroflexi bacterium]|nr:50S ribosomal protein L20 [Chloroflexota bacterium]
MTRVKAGFVTHRRHHKVLAQTKGHRASRHLLYEKAQESWIKALSYAYAHRRERKGDFRRLWIQRINIAARAQGISYSVLMSLFRRAGVAVNRKMLADLAVRDKAAFDRLLAQARDKAEALAT